MRNRKLSVLILALVLVVLRDASAQPKPGAVEAQSKPDEKVSEKPLEQESFTLENSLSLRDPFRRPPSKVAKEFAGGGILPELERYELDKFKLVGVVTGPRKNKAMVTTPDGKMHIVSETMHIGTRHGVIKRIAPGRVSVEEKVVNLLGQEENIETTIEFESKDKNKNKETL